MHQPYAGVVYLAPQNMEHNKNNYKLELEGGRIAGVPGPAGMKQAIRPATRPLQRPATGWPHNKLAGVSGVYNLGPRYTVPGRRFRRGAGRYS